MTQVRLFTSAGEISQEIYTIEPGSTDHKGNVTITSKHRKVKTRPDRLLPLGGDGAPVKRLVNTLRSHCPKCNCEVMVDIKSSKSAVCPEHGQFTLDWSHVSPGIIPIEVPNRQPGQTRSVRLKNNQRSQQTLKIDFERYRRLVEIWTNTDVHFDYPHYKVESHAMLIGGDRPRKMCFNSYNGTWGKVRSRASDVEAFLSGKQPADRHVFTYLRAELGQARAELQKKGYHLDKASTKQK